jgi:hypothetical protein
MLKLLNIETYLYQWGLEDRSQESLLCQEEIVVNKGFEFWCGTLNVLFARSIFVLLPPLQMYF